MHEVFKPGRAPARQAHIAWEIHHVAQQALERGEDVIILSVGDPDFATPDIIVERAVSALRDGDTHYSEVIGRAPLRAAIARDHARQTGRPVDASHVIVVAGAQTRPLREFVVPV